MMDQRHEFHLFASNDSFNHIIGLIIIVILEVVQMLIRSDESLVTKLLFEIDPESFDSVSHRISRLDSR